jgi:site-specific DNA-cytosine methylase
VRVLIACEYSGVVREAFRSIGYDAVSCDLLPTEVEGPHIQGDVLDLLRQGWDLMIAHPPCTHLSVSGALHHSKKRDLQMQAIGFARALYSAPIRCIALENPVSVLSTYIGKPDQIIQPWYFGHDERKTTCLWLKNLPPLTPTRFGVDQAAPMHNLSPSKERGKLRSKTYEGIAAAMAEQWGPFVAQRIAHAAV